MLTYYFRIKTDMGGEDAPGTLDEGIVTSSYLI